MLCLKLLKQLMSGFMAEELEDRGWYGQMESQYDQQQSSAGQLAITSSFIAKPWTF